MDKQQEQMNQNLNQGSEYISGFLEEEKVEELEFNEPKEEQEKAENLVESEKNKNEEQGHSKKPKRTRKTIEQELADLDAKRQRLMEKKRSQETHEKIVFGSTIIAMLKDMKETNDKNGPTICEIIKAFTEVEQPKNLEIIKKIISNINK